ncbi:MAG: glycosyltransferase family 2 protein [Actinobacteria bacterium]|nr:glycosyltransferase family 2 protein [Actinomycetota bacterium]
MFLLIATPVLLITLISIINFLTIIEPKSSSLIEEFISVILPVRNEAANIHELVACLKAQTQLEIVEFIFLDDNSEDETLSLLESELAGLSGFRVIKGAPLPHGWIGKTWALHQLLEASSGEIIVSIDADVRLSPDAISCSVTSLKGLALDFVSPYPRQLTQSLAERLVQPLLQWSWMATLLLFIAKNSSHPSMAVANGQFFIVRRSALLDAGGYESVKADVLDDVFLARNLIRSKAHGTVLNGASIATCRMYSSWSQIESGYGKSLNRAFGSIVGSIFAIAFLFLTGLAPIVAALTGGSWGWIAYSLVVLTRVLSAIPSKGRIIDSLLHPISSIVLIYLIVYSWLMRGTIEWKGRAV